MSNRVIHLVLTQTNLFLAMPDCLAMSENVYIRRHKPELIVWIVMVIIQVSRSEKKCINSIYYQLILSNIHGRPIDFNVICTIRVIEVHVGQLY